MQSTHHLTNTIRMKRQGERRNVMKEWVEDKQLTVTHKTKRKRSKKNNQGKNCKCKRRLSQDKQREASGRARDGHHSHQGHADREKGHRDTERSVTKSPKFCLLTQSPVSSGRVGSRVDTNDVRVPPCEIFVGTTSELIEHKNASGRDRQTNGQAVKRANRHFAFEATKK